MGCALCNLIQLSEAHEPFPSESARQDFFNELAGDIAQNHPELIEKINTCLKKSGEALVSAAPPKFKVGDNAKVVRLLDNMTDQGLIGFTGKVTEVDPLPNGDFNYYVDGHYMHEAELEYAGCKICGADLGGSYAEVNSDSEVIVVFWDTGHHPIVLKMGDCLCRNCQKKVEHYRRFK